MSDNRKILVAKRKNDRGKVTNLRNNQETNFKRGIKRPVVSNDAPKRNLANDRLKRLRTTINDEAQKSGREPSKILSASVSNNRSVKPTRYNNARKRPQTVPEQAVALKLIKSSSTNAFHFKEEYTVQRSTYSTAGPNPFAVSNLNEAPREAQAFTEDMEWSPTDESSVPLTGTSSTSKVQNVSSTGCHKLNTSKKKFFIVVDTNVFLSDLQIIKNIVTANITGDIKPVVYIPWMVLEELNFIKDDFKKSNLKAKAQNVNKYIEQTLRSKNDRMMGQTLDEANEQKDAGKSQDNKIIACCLQVLEKYENMILVTGDINLKNKAHINNIPVCSDTEILAKVMALNVNHTKPVLNHTKPQMIMDKMTTLCSRVIEECAKNTYGSVYNRMPICQSSPKSLQDCISIFNKFWGSVFQALLMKQSKKSIDDLSAFLNKNKNIRDSSQEINELVRLCVRVCLFLKDIDGFKSIIENTIRDLNTIKGP